MKALRVYEVHHEIPRRIRKRTQSFGAYVPDLPGCVAAAKNRREVKRLIREAIQLQIEDMRDRGYPIPKPTAASVFVERQPTTQ
jgi:predicted RNase H-like HicB family nuclease